MKIAVEKKVQSHPKSLMMKVTTLIISQSITGMILLYLALLCFTDCSIAVGDPQSKEDQQEIKYAQLRETMVHEQIEARGIQNKAVLEALRKVKRHAFVPSFHQDLAYTDQPLPIGEGQTISQPYIVAFMTESLELKKTDKALEIGTGSGYQAAVLAELCSSVYTVEIIESLGKRAAADLKSQGYANVHVKIGDGYKGWSENAPYDAIIVTCSPSHVPKPLQDQLAEDGRMIIPVGDFPAQELVLLKKKAGELTRQAILPVLFVPMMDPEGRKY
jgi:protein-L-isoaspartate(D-aspartate) O-methyltransferase